jgi:hypothetical protein
MATRRHVKGLPCQHSKREGGVGSDLQGLDEETFWRISGIAGAMCQNRSSGRWGGQIEDRRGGCHGIFAVVRF